MSRVPVVDHPRMSRSRAFTTVALLFFLVGQIVGIGPKADRASAATSERIDLRILLVDDGEPWMTALANEMTVEGVPFTTVALMSPTRPTITSSFLASGTRAFFQAVILPNATGGTLSAAEVTALRSYEATFGVREVDAFVYASPAVGLSTPSVTGDIAGTTATVTAAGLLNGFQYLNGPVPYSTGSYSYVSQPLSATSTPPMPPGASFTTLLSAPIPNSPTPGSLIGVYAAGGVEQMVITSAMNFELSQFKLLAHGIVTWATRGIHLGYSRNRMTFHIDDAFASDTLWDPVHNCTPDEDCPRNPDGTSVYPASSIRMTPADVTAAVQWQTAHDYTLTLPFNGFYADTNDALTQALVANKNSFRWLNHGFQHIFQGCVQDFTVAPWMCTTDVTNKTVWVTEEAIAAEINDNIVMGVSYGLPFDPTEYLSGEHSGLALLPQQLVDNPNFVSALTQSGLKTLGADASRDVAPRPVGSAVTVPRHPTILYFNASTVAEEVDEYNWLYTTRADGGSGYCEDNPLTATCVTPLTADGFTSTIVPNDAAYDLSFVLSNDPRPFYAHTSNMAGERILYPLLESILGTYRAAFAASAPLQNLTLTEVARELEYQAGWAANGMTSTPSVNAYLENGVVTITNSGTSWVPLTAPPGATVNGGSLVEYGGELSSWLAPTGTTTVFMPALPVPVVGGSPDFLIGQAGQLTITTPGSPAATLSVSGVLPSGLQYTSTGDGHATVSGTPAAGTGGTFPLVISAINGSGRGQTAATIRVGVAPQITSAPSVTAAVGAPLVFQITSTGSPAPTLTAQGALPAGITFTAHADGTATVSGTAQAATGGDHPLTLTAQNWGGNVTQAFTLTITQKPAFTNSDAATAIVGSPFSFMVATAGSPTATVSMTGTLPKGITFTAHADGTATLAGTPTGPGTSVLDLTAANQSGTATQAFKLVVADVVAQLPKAGPDYIPVVPERLLDTRPTSLIGHSGDKPTTGQTIAVDVIGVGTTNVPAGATAVVLNITGTEATANGYVTVWPCGTPRPTASNLNITAGIDAPNLVISKVGDGGAVCVFTQRSMHLIADINGYMPADSVYVPVVPDRALDTRNPGGIGYSGAKPVAGQTIQLTITGVGAVKIPSDARAVVLNVTGTEAGADGYVTVWPCGTPRPTASNLNLHVGIDRPNLVVSQIGADGKVCLFTQSGGHLVADINGYMPTKSGYTPMVPRRILETRADGQTGYAGDKPVAGAVIQLDVVGSGSSAVPADAAAVVLNITGTEATSAGFVTVWPCGAPRPMASNLNLVAGDTSPNLVMSKIGAGGNVCIFTESGTHLVADIGGYWPPST